MPNMTTYSGKQFDPLQIELNDISMEDIAHALCMICRGGGHLRNFYSVGQHSVNCANEAKARGLSDRIVLACLLHDASEAYISDIIRPVKEQISEYKVYEDRIMDKIWEKYGLADLMEEELKEVKQIDDDMLYNELNKMLDGTQNIVAPELKSVPDFGRKDVFKMKKEFLQMAYGLLGDNKALYKIVIVGGGIAGLTAGIYARLAGFDTEIYEKNKTPGGNCSYWKRGEYTIDNCIHWMIGTKENTPQHKIWIDTGALNDNVVIVKRESFFSCEFEGQTITLWRDINRTRDEMIAIAPEDAVEINRFIEYTRFAIALQQQMENSGMLTTFLAMDLEVARFKMTKIIIQYFGMSLEKLASRFKHPLLQKLFTDFMAKEYESYWLVFAYSFFITENGDIPEGGSMGIVSRMVKRYKSLGGKLFLNSPVKQVCVGEEEKKVATKIYDRKSDVLYKIKNIKTRNASGIILEDDKFVDADYVICACDIHHTFSKLLPKQYLKGKFKRSCSDRKKIPIYSSFQMAFAVDGLMEEVNDTINFPCEPLDVGVHIFDRLEIKNYRCYGDYIAPPGKTVVQVSIVQYGDDYKYWHNLKKMPESYAIAKKNVAEAVKTRIEKRFPEYEGKLTLLDVWTPETYANRNNCHMGAYMRFITTFTSRIAFLPSDIKGLGNVFLASHWLRYPGGIPMAAAMGKNAIDKIEEKMKSK